MSDQITDLDVDLTSDPSLLPPVLAFFAGLAGWVGPALKEGVAGISSQGFSTLDAWETPLYWMAAIPLLFVALAFCGYAASTDRWRLASWALAGHIIGMIWIHPVGTSLSLLPLAVAFLALFVFPLLWFAAILGGFIGRMRARA